MPEPRIGAAQWDAQPDPSQRILKTTGRKVRSRAKPALASPAVASASTDIVLDSIQGKGYPVRDWLTSYPLIMVALDPFTHESAWLLETAGQLLRHYTPADITVAWLVAADDDGCREFLGPWSEEFLTFADPERSAIKGFELQTLPALIHVRNDGAVQMANGWDPTAWRAIAEVLSVDLSWSRPMIPKPGDPVPYPGTSAEG
jgi:hypothetical protein